MESDYNTLLVVNLSTALMDKLFDDQGLFAVLGLGNVTEEEKTNYILRISKVVIAKAIESANEQGIVDVETLEGIQNQMSDANMKPEDTQRLLLDKIPGFLNLVKEEFNKFRTNALISQVASLLTHISTGQTKVDHDDLVFLNQFISDIIYAKDLSIETLNRYNTVKTKYNFN